MLDGVAYGDQKCLLEQRRVGDYPCRWAFDAHADARALGQGFHDLGRGMGNIREIDRFQLWLSPAPADAGEPEEGVGEALRTLGVAFRPLPPDALEREVDDRVERTSSSWAWSA